MALADTRLAESQGPADLLHGEIVLVVRDHDHAIPLIQALARLIEELAVIAGDDEFAPVAFGKHVMKRGGVLIRRLRRARIELSIGVKRGDSDRIDLALTLRHTLQTWHPIHLPNVVDARSVQSKWCPRRKGDFPLLVKPLDAVNQGHRRTRREIVQVRLDVDLQFSPAVERHKPS